MKTINVKCRMCGADCSISCEEKDYIKWKNGEGFVQDVFHYLSADERELLISQTCGKCFDEMFPPCEEDEGEE